MFKRNATFILRFMSLSVNDKRGIFLLLSSSTVHAQFISLYREKPARREKFFGNFDRSSWMLI